MLINLNANQGESFGAFTMGNVAALLGIVSSANVACGLHGGDLKVCVTPWRAPARAV